MRIELGFLQLKLHVRTWIDMFKGRFFDCPWICFLNSISAGSGLRLESVNSIYGFVLCKLRVEVCSMSASSPFSTSNFQ